MFVEYIPTIFGYAYFTLMANSIFWQPSNNREFLSIVLRDIVLHYLKLLLRFPAYLTKRKKWDKNCENVYIESISAVISMTPTLTDQTVHQNNSNSHRKGLVRFLTSEKSWII